MDDACQWDKIHVGLIQYIPGCGMIGHESIWRSARFTDTLSITLGSWTRMVDQAYLVRSNRVMITRGKIRCSCLLENYVAVNDQLSRI